MIEKILLDNVELIAAKSEAFRRQTINETQNRRGRNNAPDSGAIALLNHETGSIGEMACAKYLNLKDHLYKDLIPIRGSVDLPPNIDVKTAHKHRHNLIVQLDEVRSKIVVHATYEGEEVQLHGWTYVSRVAKDCFIKEPVPNRAAYFVTPSVLHSMQLLNDFLIDLGYSK